MGLPGGGKADPPPGVAARQEQAAGVAAGSALIWLIWVCWGMAWGVQGWGRALYGEHVSDA